MSPSLRLLEDSLRSVADTVIKRLEPLSLHTSFRLGGPSRLWVEPGTLTALAAVVKGTEASGIQWMVMGGGTNLLFPDSGFDGVIISTIRLQRYSVSDRVIRAEAGVPLARIVTCSIRSGLAGLTELAGIPGTIGGAIAGNAGVQGHDVFTPLRRVELVDRDGTIRWIAADELDHGYRQGGIPSGSVVCAAEWAMEPDAPDMLRARARAALKERSEKQPSGEPSAGCVFKNPAGQSAGKLMDEAGLKGARVGGAVVSDTHANWIVLDGPATSKDVMRLIEFTRKRIHESTGILLETEIVLVRTAGV